MWIKRRNSMLLVRVKSEKIIPIIVPVSLFVLHETIRDFRDWLALWKVAAGKIIVYQTAFGMVHWLADLFETIRRLGPFRLVEVETPEVNVYIDLW